MQKEGVGEMTPSIIKLPFWETLIVKVVVSKNLYFLFVQVIRYCSVPDVSINK